MPDQPKSKIQKLKTKLNLVIAFTVLAVSLSMIVVLTYYPLKEYLGSRAANTLTVCAGGSCDYTSITAALAAADPDDTVDVQAGTYNEASGETFPLAIADNNLTLNGAGSTLTIIEGPGSGDQQAYLITANEISGVTIQNVGITGAPSGGGSATVQYQDCNNCTFQNNRVYETGNSNDNASAIHVRSVSVATTNTISNNTIYDIGTGIAFLAHDETSDLTATANNNLIYNFASQGLSPGWQAGTMDVTAYNNTINGGAWGVFLNSGGTLTFYNNIISNITNWGVIAYLGGTVNSSFNAYYNNDSGHITGAGDGTANSTNDITDVDPAYVSLTSGSEDFSLQPWSGCIAAGSGDGSTADNTTDLGYVDFTGTAISTITVAPSGANYTSVASALAAVPGTVGAARTVNVSAGTYSNQNVTMKSYTTLSCTDTAGTCILDGGAGSNNVVNLSSLTEVSISGFTVQNSGTGGGFYTSVSPLSVDGTPYTYAGDNDGVLWDPDITGAVEVQVSSDNTNIPLLDGTSDINVALCLIAGAINATLYHPNSIADNATDFGSWWSTDVGGGTPITCSYYIEDIFTANGATSNYTYSGDLTLTEGSGTVTLASGFDTTTPFLSFVPYAGISVADSGTAGTPITLSNNTLGTSDYPNGSGLYVSGTSVVTSTDDIITNNNSYNLKYTSTGTSTLTNTDFEYDSDTSLTSVAAGTVNASYNTTVTVTSDLDDSALESVAITYTDGQEGTGSFTSETDSSGQSTQALQGVQLTASGATDYSSYTITATGAGDRATSSAATIDQRSETLAIALDYTAPTSTSISINSGDPDTSETEVTLTLAATGASQMMVSENSDFSGASWEDYATSKSLTLSSGDGTKTVYAKFRDAFTNTSSAVNDTIDLSTPTRRSGPSRTPPPPPPAPADDSSDEGTEGTEGTEVVDEEVAEEADEEGADEEVTEGDVKEEGREEKEGDVAEVIQEKKVIAPKVTQVTTETGETQLVVSEPEKVEKPQEILPEEREETKEIDGIGLFGAIHGYLPSSDQDWIFVSWIAYDLQPESRDLDKEHQAIAEFKAKYETDPSSDVDWSLVRALAYVE